MAEITEWVKKVWKNRITEFPTRRTLTKEDGSSEIVTVTRNEGTVSEEGDAFDADTMNNLEERIDAGFTEVNRKLSGKIEIELLWENPNTGVDFEAQEIELPTLNKYSFYFIIFSGSTYGGGKTEGINTGFIPIDRATELLYLGSYMRWRGVTRSDNGIRIGQGNMVQAYGTSTKANSVCIPVEIYGVK